MQLAQNRFLLTMKLSPNHERAYSVISHKQTHTHIYYFSLDLGIYSLVVFLFSSLGGWANDEWVRNMVFEQQFLFAVFMVVTEIRHHTFVFGYVAVFFV
jgi:hypothetical protein